MGTKKEMSMGYETPVGPEVYPEQELRLIMPTIFHEERRALLPLEAKTCRVRQVFCFSRKT